MKILTIGGATQDVFIQNTMAESVELIHDDIKNSFLLLQEGAKIEIDSLQFATGGGATNIAVALRRLGCDVSCVCKIGDDEAGRSIVAELTKEQVLTAYCTVDAQEHTGISYIISSNNNEKTVLAYRGANKFLIADDIPYIHFQNYSYIYLSSLSGQSAQLLTSITQAACAQQCTVIVNPGINQLRHDSEFFLDSLPYIDVLIFNRKEAEECMRLLYSCLSSTQRHCASYTIENDCALLKDFMCVDGKVLTLPFFFELLVQKGLQIVVVTNGKDGVYIYYKKNIYYHPSLEVVCVSTLGAGDAFGSAFVAGLASSFSIETAIRMAILNSASVIQYTDAKTGLLTMKMLDCMMPALDSQLLQKYWCY